MSSFVNDNFSGESLGGQWTTSGPGDVSVSGGHLRITVDETTYTYVTQSGISGEFDLVARLKDAFYPSLSPSAVYQCGFYISLDSDNHAQGYQNFNPSETKNEAKLVLTVEGFPYGGNPEIDPMEYICIRIRRDASNDFYVYYNTESDGSGSWVESGAAGALN